MRSILIFSFFLLTTCLLSEVAGSQPTLRNGTYEIKEGNLLSQTWKVATVEFDVGEDLYFPVVIPCVHCLPTNSNNECVCNYASKKGEGCGVAPKGCPQDTCKQEDLEKYCNDPLLEPWTELHYSRKDDFEDYTTLPNQRLVLGEIKYYRLRVTDPCRGYFIKLNFDFGIADIMFSTIYPEPTQLNLQRFTDYTRYPDHIELLLCPDDPVFQLGTFFLAIVGRSPNVSYDIDIYSSKTLLSTSKPEEDVYFFDDLLCKDDDGFYCLDSEITYRVGFPEVIVDSYYRYDVEVKEAGECVDLTVFLHCFTGDGDVFGNWDVPNFFTDTLIANYIAEIQGSDVIYTQRCFDSPGTYFFYFNVNAWDPGLYYLSVSTKTPIFLKKGLDLSAYQYGYSATRYISAQCPSFNISCDDWGFSCTNMWSVYPSTDLDPFWPIPPTWNARASPFSSAMFGTLREHETPLLHPTNGKVSLVVLLENNLFGKSSIYMTEDQLRQCTFTGLGSAFSKDKRALVGSAGIRRVQPECDNEKLKQVLAVGRDYIKRLDQETTFDSILQLTYQVNTLMFSTSWLSCINFMESLLNVTSAVVPTPSTACLVKDSNSKEYLEDPCCNQELLTTQCCLERDLPWETLLYNNVDEKELAHQCTTGTEECATSYLGDYLFIKKNSVRCTSFESDQYPALIASSVQSYRQCKTKHQVDAIALGLKSCHFDSDCAIDGIKNTRCNRVTNRCESSYEVERAVLECLVSGLSEYTEHYLSEAFNISGQKEDKHWFGDFEKAFVSDQCINVYGDPIAERRSSLYTTKSPTCGGSIGGCATTQCLDTSCEITPTTCISLCGMNWIDLVKQNEDNKNQCERKQKCNWMGDPCDDNDIDCEHECVRRKPFCGYCTDPAHCVPIPGIESQEQCESAEACYLPDGTIELLTESECKKRQKCDQPCHNGLGCESRNKADDLCVSKNETESECRGDWSAELQLCTYPRYGLDLCQSAGFEFYSCTGLSLEQCQACYNEDQSNCPVDQAVLQCHVVPRVKCETRSQCLSNGGSCSDALWYQDFGNIDDDFGGCVESQKYDFNTQVQPDCPRTPVIGSLTPNGCYSRGYYPNEKNCSTVAGASFHRLASSQRECERAQGCDNYFQVYSLAPMSKTHCTECGYERSSYFSWTPGVWRHGDPIKLEWKKPSMEALHKWSKGVNFPLLYQSLISAGSATLLADLQSQVFCDFNAQSVPVEVTNCACGDNSGHHNSNNKENCFLDSDKPLKTGVGRPCIGLGARVQTLDAGVGVSETGVDVNSPSRCVEISLSTVSIYSYQQPTQVAFSPLTKVRDYDTFDIVKNDDDAVVGRVISNGLLVEMDGSVLSYTICLTELSEVANSGSSRYNTYDIGVPRSGDKDFLRPLLLKPLRLPDVSAPTYCFLVENPELKNTYFLVKTVSNPTSKDGSLYGSEATAWWVFAAIYSFLGLATLATFLSHYFGYKLHFYFLGLFLFLSVMCTVRAVYFYTLAAGVFDESDTTLAVAYFLIEFPTLLYFTAFSCLAAFWLFLLFAHRQDRLHHRLVLFFTIVFNLILYLLFVVFIVLYQTLNTESSSALCPGRIPSNQDNTNQQIVSLVYQGIMAGVSLVLALIVAIFGGKLFFSLKKRDFEGKIAIVTVVCASGLLLHCGFILYLTATLEYDFTVIVLMITLSEILPLSWVTFQFSLLRFVSKGRKLPSYNQKAKFGRALRFFKSSTSTPSSSNFSGDQNTSSKTSHSKTVADPSSMASAATERP